MPTRTTDAKWLKNQKRWQIKVQANGVRKTFSSSTPGRAGKADANRKADEWLSSELVDSSVPTSAVWDKWIESVISEDALYKAKSFWKNHFYPIGKKQIGKLNVGDLQSVVDSAAKKGLAKKTLANMRATLTAFIKWSRKNNYTAISTEDLTIPKNAPKAKKIILQPDDIRKIWQSKDTMYSNVFKFAILTGLRPGELLGLQWGDIKDNRLFISRSVNFKGNITDGKNENAQRVIWLGDYELAVLDAQRKSLNKRHVISPWVFPSRYGTHAYQVNVYESWKLFSKNNGITPGVTPYGWRHTFISINNDMPEGLKRRRVGHSQNMDTEGIYGHAIAGEEEQAAEHVKQRFDTIFKPTSKPT